MAAAKKKTRKELLNEPDEFITTSSRVLGWAATYKNEISYAVLGVLVLVAVVSGYGYYVDRQEAKASELLGKALARYDRLAAEKSKDKAVQETAGEFRQVISDYGSRSNGSIARLIFANLCYEAGDFKQAVELYQASLGRFNDYPVVHFQILKSLGYALEGLKDHAAAAGFFEQALSVGDKSMQDDVLFHLGELYARLGNAEKSTAAFTRILSEHKDSVYANLVRHRVN